MIGNGLAYLSVVVRDVEAVAEMLNRDFRLEASMLTVGSSGTRTPVFSIGETAVALFEVGDPFVGGAERTGVHHLAVSVDFPVSAGINATELGMPVLSDSLEWGIGGTQRLLLSPEYTGGVVTYLTEPLSLPRQDPEVVERIDHVGVASEDNDLACDVFSHRLGWTVESTQTDAGSGPSCRDVHLGQVRRGLPPQERGIGRGRPGRLHHHRRLRTRVSPRP